MYFKCWKFLIYIVEATLEETDNDETPDYKSRTLTNVSHEQKPGMDHNKTVFTNIEFFVDTVLKKIYLDTVYNNHQTPTIIVKEESKIMIPTNLQPLPKEIQISPGLIVEDAKKGNF